MKSRYRRLLLTSHTVAMLAEREIGEYPKCRLLCHPLPGLRPCVLDPRVKKHGAPKLFGGIQEQSAQFDLRAWAACPPRIHLEHDSKPRRCVCLQEYAKDRRFLAEPVQQTADQWAAHLGWPFLIPQSPQSCLPDARLRHASTLMPSTV